MIGLFAGTLVAHVAAVHAFAAPRINAESDVKASEKDLLQYISVFGPDDRIPQTRRPVGGHSTGYSAIGRVFTNRLSQGGLSSTGTAFLVSPCVAMTNYHVVFGSMGVDTIISDVKELNHQFKANRDGLGNVKITLPNSVDYSMTFLVGEKSDGTFKRKAIGRPLAFGNMNKQGGVAYDWVAIKFDEPNCPGSDPEIGWLDIDASSQDKIDQMDLQTAGYTGAHNPFITFKGKLDRSSRPCHSYGQRLEQEAMIHDCPSSEGQSGGPLFYVEGGKLKIVGINRGPHIERGNGIYPNYDRRSRNFDKYANEAVGVQAFLPEVSPIIKRDLVAHGLDPGSQ